MTLLARPHPAPLTFAFITALTTFACSSDDGSTSDAVTPDGGGGGSDAGPATPGFPADIQADLEDSGVGKYLGLITPSGESTTDDVTEYSFDSANDGPVCIDGSPYTVLTRDQGSEDLLIYLEGGGACWSSFCAAKMATTHSLPTGGIVDATASTNVVADWNLVYVPYCDGSAFLGDNEVDDATMPDGKRRHYGIRNLSAAIDIAKAKFPNPRRILLAGSSAGGFGTITGTGIVRLVFPNTELMVFNDAGLGIDNPDDPGSQERKDEWKYLQFVPSTCEGCVDDASKVPAWGLAHDPTLRVAAFSSYEDSVIGATFLKMDGPAFKALLLEKTGATHDAFPERFRRFFIPGGLHTTLITDETADPNASGGLHGYLTPEEGMSVSDWTTAFVDGTSDWTDRLLGGG